MDVVVLVKQVPDTFSERRLGDDLRLVRDGADAVIDEIDARGVEMALQLTESDGGEVTVMTMGPAQAVETLRKALAMGADKAVHVTDDALAGADALTTAKVLAAALGTVRFDLLLAGDEATDGRGGVVPAMIAELLSLPTVTQVQRLSVSGGVVNALCASDGGDSEVTASLPAVVTVTEKLTEPRYPNFKGIMKAKRKPLTTLSAADLGVSALSAVAVLDAEQRPPRAAGPKITDDGTGGVQVAEFLVAEKLI